MFKGKQDSDSQEDYPKYPSRRSKQLKRILTFHAIKERFPCKRIWHDDERYPPED